MQTKWWFRSVVAIAAATVLNGMPAAMAACTDEALAIDLPAQRLDERLQALVHSTGCGVQVDPSVLENVRASALRGSFEPAAAFRESIKGSGLEAYGEKGQWVIDNRSQDEFRQRVNSTLKRLAQKTGPGGTVPPQRATDLQSQLAGIEGSVAQTVAQDGYLSADKRAEFVDAINRLDSEVGE